jgi:TPP-dependent pyruvate/acetoin dehydrogenase alpha subunit
MANCLTAQNIIVAHARRPYWPENQGEVDTAVKFAIDAPYPDANKVDQDVYA